jgi:hypothetical protein
MTKRVRHHTDDAALERIRRTNGIEPSRGWGAVESGVHVEVEPFGTARPFHQRSPKAELGCDREGAYVEFDAPESMITYYCGPRNAAIVPVAPGQVLSVDDLAPVFVKVRSRWWQIWRTKVE